MERRKTIREGEKQGTNVCYRGNSIPPKLDPYATYLEVRDGIFYAVELELSIAV
jgi:hypothetical protein